jgi:hypothetical protein
MHTLYFITKIQYLTQIAIQNYIAFVNFHSNFIQNNLELPKNISTFFLTFLFFFVLLFYVPSSKLINDRLAGGRSHQGGGARWGSRTGDHVPAMEGIGVQAPDGGCDIASARMIC